MRLNLGKHWQQKLSELPESGMGWQQVDIRLKDGRTLRDVTVYNGEDSEVDEPFDVKQILDIVLHKK